MRRLILATVTTLGLVGSACQSTEPFQIGAACGACTTLTSAGFCYGCCTGDPSVAVQPPTGAELAPAQARTSTRQTY